VGKNLNEETLQMFNDGFKEVDSYEKLWDTLGEVYYEVYCKMTGNCGGGSSGGRPMPDFSKLQSFFTGDLASKFYQPFKDKWAANIQARMSEAGFS
jgi:hypothetical protein